MATFSLSACMGQGGVPECPEEEGVACTWAGIEGERGYMEEGVLRTESWLNFPADLTFGPENRAWLNDWNNHRISVVEHDGRFRTVIGTDYEGDGPRDQSDELPRGDPEGALGTTVALNHPTDIVFLPDDTLVFAAWHNNKIRVMDYETEMVRVIAGDEYGYAGDGGPAYEAIMDMPKSVVTDSQGQIYVLDQVNERIRRITAGETRMIDTIAGTGDIGYEGDGSEAMNASFHFDASDTPVPSGALAMRGSELYIADTLNHRIRKLDLETGMIELIAGTGEATYAGDGGPAIEASFNQPTDLEFGPDGRLYVADSANNVIRAIDLESGIVERVAGNAQLCGQPIYCYEDEKYPAALDVQLLLPWGIAFDAEGDLYIADTNNQRIVKVNL